MAWLCRSRPGTSVMGHQLCASNIPARRDERRSRWDLLIALGLGALWRAEQLAGALDER